MNIKLAEYCLRNGSFRGFIELDSSESESGRTFLVGSDYIEIYDYDNICPNKNIPISNIYFRDQKDPFNRYDGLFHGFTYGKGRFILIINDNGDIWEQSLCGDSGEELFSYGIMRNGDLSVKYLPLTRNNRVSKFLPPKKTGNIFETKLSL